MKIWKYPDEASARRLSVIARRGLGFRKKDIQAVTRMLEDVRKNGDAAVLRYARRFDSPDMEPSKIRVDEEEMQAAARKTDRDFRRALRRANQQISDFHQRQKQRSWMTMDREGVFLGQMLLPVGAAGIYVPGGQGGRTPLVSSVLMCGIPAKTAGVKRLVMMTPAGRDGSVHPHLLSAAKTVGVDEVFKVGSAWAIAALAYGTESIQPVDVIAGPGNMYVTIAKKLVAGTVGIDMVAGPSEILIIADDSAHPDFVAADLLSQAEHDPLASSILATASRSIAEAVLQSVRRQLDELQRKDVAAESLRRFGAIFLVPSLEDAFALANAVAPEHLELHLQNPMDYLGKIRNAGAVFLGEYTPEPMGDYIAGPNHVLPTAGTARFSSALSVDHFTKKTSVIRYTREAFQREAKDVIRLAETEGLQAHARSVRVRQKIQPPGE